MTVYLVGAGPGDPGLVTIRAAALLATAEVVVHDRLVDRAVIAMAPDDAEIVDVGKRPGDHAMTQAAINALLIERGRTYGVVVRLKGGDPYVFGRGGEEAESLAAAGVAYEVVPGVSSFVAAPSAAGVPLTMRGVASAFTVVTGHDVTNRESPVEWEAIARSGATLVVLMGGAARGAIADRLIAAGCAPATPVAVVISGTLPGQRTIHTTLDALGVTDVSTPATIIVGEVARFGLASYEDRPLAGRRIVVTRAAEGRTELESMLRVAGAEAVALPTIAITEPADGGAALAKAAGEASRYEWIVFSSQNAVERFFAHLRDVRGLGTARLAVIGTATAAALARHGLVADLVPLRFVDESLLEAFVAPEGTGRVLLPRAAVARDLLPDGLRALGWQVDVVEAYRTVRPPLDPGAREAVAGADTVTFLSSSAATGFLDLLGIEAMPPTVASIGPVTSATLRDAGVRVDIESDEHTARGLVAALVAAAGPGRSPRH